MKQYNRILFVAESGTSRAPMAAGILSEYTLKHPVTIECRGLVVLFPEPLSQKAEAVMISNGINWENFTSTQLEDEDFTDDTLVLTMEHSQLEKILKNTQQEEPPTARYLQEHEKVALYSRLLMWEIVTAQRKVIRIQICLWMNLLILRNKLFRIYFLRIYTKLY